MLPKHENVCTCVEQNLSKKILHFDYVIENSSSKRTDVVIPSVIFLAILLPLGLLTPLSTPNACVSSASPKVTIKRDCFFSGVHDGNPRRGLLVIYTSDVSDCDPD